MNRRPIIIDTDPGVDDTIAIMLANANRDKLDIKAITPVTGNVPYSSTSQNAIRLVKYLGMDCKVGIGADNPLFIASKTAGDIHGAGGLGGYMLPESDKEFDGYAWDIIKEEAEKANGELEIITLGPLTNIAITLMRYPHIKPLIKRIVCMAGATTMGNMNAYAEFNVWVDPDACEIVFNSGVPVVMCGLDGNDFCGLSIDELKEYMGRNTSVRDLFDHIFSFFIKRRIAGGPDDAIQVINDAITMAYFLDPEIGKTESYYVTCETKGGLCQGQTLVDRAGRMGKAPNVEVLVWSNKPLYKKMLNDMLDFYSL